MEQNHCDYQWQHLSDDEDLRNLKLELGQIFEENDSEEKIFYSSQSTTDQHKQIIIINLPDLIWRSTELYHFENPPIYSLTISGDSRFVFTGHSDGNVRQWDLHLKQHSKTYISGQSELIAVELTPDQQTIFATGLNSRIVAWNVQSQDIFVGFFGLGSYLSHQATINCLASSPNGKILGSGGNDGLIKLWDLKTGKWKRNFNGHQGSVKAVVFEADGQRIVSGYENGCILIWKINDWQYQSNLGSHDQPITDLILIDDGRILISSSTDGTIKIWDLQKECCLESFKAHGLGLLRIAINPITKLIAIATNKEVKVLEWGTHQCLQVLNAFFSIKFSSDGEFLVTYSISKVIKVWQLQDRKKETKFQKFSLDLQWWEVLGVSPDDDARTVKLAYYKLAKKYHPDQNISNAEQSEFITAMQKINQAYEFFCRLTKELP